MNLAKATHIETRTSSIVVSFDSKGRRFLLNGEITTFVRRRGPKTFEPECVYAYINSPVSALVARLPVLRFEWRSGYDATLSDKSKLHRHEMREYTGAELYAVFHVGKPRLARTEIPLKQLQSKLGFVPAKSFFVVSISGKQELDVLGRFRVTEARIAPQSA